MLSLHELLDKAYGRTELEGKVGEHCDSTSLLERHRLSPCQALGIKIFYTLREILI